MALGSVYCAEHAPVTTGVPPEVPPRSSFIPEPPVADTPYSASGSSTPYTAPASTPYTAPASMPYTAPASMPYTAPGPVCDRSSHPVLAFMLGFIPGVGALYNGQLAKGLIHAVVFGLLVSITSGSHNGSLEPLFGIMIAAWVFYMAFEAYHTAKRRRDGGPVEEFSSLFDIRPTHGRFPAGAIFLIGIGFVLLLDTTDIIDVEQLDRYWPVGLILLGLYMLYARLSGDRNRTNGNAEARR
jgi:TM2 domain-containing membrane protein YozV